MSDLKPCPFCGGIPFTTTIVKPWVWCAKEGCPGRALTLPLGEWNTRPVEDALRNELARLNGRTNFRCLCGGTKVEVAELTAKIAHLETVDRVLGDLHRLLTDAGIPVGHVADRVRAVVEQRDAALARCADAERKLKAVREWGKHVEDTWFDGSSMPKLRALLDGEEG